MFIITEIIFFAQMHQKKAICRKVYFGKLSRSPGMFFFCLFSYWCLRFLGGLTDFLGATYFWNHWNTSKCKTGPQLWNNLPCKWFYDLDSEFIVHNCAMKLRFRFCLSIRYLYLHTVVTSYTQNVSVAQWKSYFIKIVYLTGYCKGTFQKKINFPTVLQLLLFIVSPVETVLHRH